MGRNRNPALLYLARMAENFALREMAFLDTRHPFYFPHVDEDDDQLGMVQGSKRADSAKKTKMVSVNKGAGAAALGRIDERKTNAAISRVFVRGEVPALPYGDGFNVIGSKEFTQADLEEIMDVNAFSIQKKYVYRFGCGGQESRRSGHAKIGTSSAHRRSRPSRPPSAHRRYRCGVGNT